MTSSIVTQSPEISHNSITKVGYQWLVWWHGHSAGYTSRRRAEAELARLQRFEIPQQQALSLLDTLYTQYDSMAEQYESLKAYIQSTFNTQKLNKIIDQLTADLMMVTQAQPQQVQQAQAQDKRVPQTLRQPNARTVFIDEMLAELEKPLQALQAMKSFLESAKARSIEEGDGEAMYDLGEVIRETTFEWENYASKADFGVMAWIITGVDSTYIYFKRNPEDFSPEELGEPADRLKEYQHDLAKMGYPVGGGL